MKATNELVRTIQNTMQYFFDCTYQSDWERTSLRPYVEMLDAHVRGLMQETRAAMLSMCTYIFS